MFKHKLTFSLLMMVVALFAMTSCSEDDNTVEEYADWVNVNDKYFDELTAKVQGMTGDTWKRVRTWSKNEAAATANSDFILMEKLDSDPEAADEYPQYTDSVKVHYQGRLIPSPTYPKGYLFDSSYSGTFDPLIASPTKFAISGVVDGFSTALLNMRRGDYYRVYIPYQLGYGTSASSSIPGGSTLIFEIRMVDFW